MEALYLFLVTNNLNINHSQHIELEIIDTENVMRRYLV
jgi:hypothetical protein